MKQRLLSSIADLFRWRQQLCARERSVTRFSPVAVVSGPEAATSTAAARDSVEIEFGNGVRLRISGSVDGSIIKAAVSVLAKIRRRR